MERSPIVESDPSRNRDEDSESKRVLCLTCDKSFSSDSHLRVHMRIHNDNRPFHCSFKGCEKKFITGYSLKIHNRVHTGDRPYACTVCPKSFKTSGDLVKHQRTHSGERPFKCSHCEKSFTTQDILKVHFRSTHSDDRPFKCHHDGCGKSFAVRTNYKNHLRVHTGERPYRCTVEDCEKTFKEYSSLRKHRRAHEEQVSLVCKDCGQSYRRPYTLAMHKKKAHPEKDIKEDPAIKPVEEACLLMADGLPALDQSDSDIKISFSCTLCSKLCQSMMGLRSHFQNDHGLSNIVISFETQPPPTQISTGAKLPLCTEQTRPETDLLVSDAANSGQYIVVTNIDPSVE